jgi:cell division septation protein DedD
MKYSITTTLIIIFLAAGCATKVVQGPAKEPVAEQAPKAPFPEQPATPAPQPTEPAPTASPAAAPRSSVQQLSGWRVQIFVSGTRENARKVAEDARWKFPDQQIFLTEYEPYYKVQIGNGLSRQAADALKQKAKDQGYPGAFPVEILLEQ